MRTFYVVMAVLGTIAPWFFFGRFFGENGFAPAAFVQGLFANGAAGGFSVDVLISIAVFWVWAWRDSIAQGVRGAWLIFPAGCLVGLSLALPLYLYLREGEAA